MQNQTHSSATGTGSFPGDILVLLVLIIGGTVLAVWFAAQPPGSREAILDRGLGIFSVILGQLGVFLTYRIVRSDELTLRKRLTYGAISVIVFVFALPFGVTTLLSNLLHKFVG